MISYSSAQLSIFNYPTTTHPECLTSNLNTSIFLVVARGITKHKRGISHLRFTKDKELVKEDGREKEEREEKSDKRRERRLIQLSLKVN